MSMISYEKNFADVMLWRVLKEVKRGFYIDIGAKHPVVDSITKTLYENGWSGINVEPKYELYKLLKIDRFRDLNVNTSISSLRMNDNDSFSKLCINYNVDEVHFLKIDVEGAEKTILEGIDFTFIRPWVIVVKANIPISQEWEFLITSQDYHFIYFDGLNRFYVANEYKELDSHFNVPPNVFDDFILFSEKEAKEKVIELKQKVKLVNNKLLETENRVSTFETKFKEAEDRATFYENLYHVVVNSNSWKITEAFRILGKKVRLLVPVSHSRRVIKKVLLFLKNKINTKPILKSKIMRLLGIFPAFRRRLQMLGKEDSAQDLLAVKIQNFEELSPHAKELYGALKKGNR